MFKSLDFLTSLNTFDISNCGQSYFNYCRLDLIVSATFAILPLFCRLHYYSKSVEFVSGSQVQRFDLECY